MPIPLGHAFSPSPSVLAHPGLEHGSAAPFPSLAMPAGTCTWNAVPGGRPLTLCRRYGVPFPPARRYQSPWATSRWCCRHGGSHASALCCVSIGPVPLLVCLPRIVRSVCSGRADFGPFFWTTFFRGAFPRPVPACPALLIALPAPPSWPGGMATFSCSHPGGRFVRAASSFCSLATAGPLRPTGSAGCSARIRCSTIATLVLWPRSRWCWACLAAAPCPVLLGTPVGVLNARAGPVLAWLPRAC